jgi:hypothetical protein
MRKDETTKLRRELEYVETEFQTRLLKALQVCADGLWGLFGQNDQGEARRYAELSPGWKEAEELLTLGHKLTGLRERLGFFEPHPLYEKFLVYRKERGPNALGEPRLARRFLDELAEESIQTRNSML